MTTAEILQRAWAVKAAVGVASDEEKRRALFAMADALEEDLREILVANAQDVQAARETISPVMIDRLTLTEERVRGMADGVRAVADLPDPVGRVLKKTERPNGLCIQKTAVPFGVIAIIYESRPNVTSDAAALALRSGNVCVLRGGKEAYRSSRAVTEALRKGLRAVNFPEDAVQLVEDISRASATELMTASGFVDLLIPRGGAGLIRACVENAKVPFLQTGTGICHIYVDKDADMEKALSIVENAKMSRPSVCNAAEVCLVHRKIAPVFLPRLYERLVSGRVQEGKTPVEFRADAELLPLFAAKPAGRQDFDTEFLDYILAVGAVDGVEDAVRHIEQHSTHHSDAIVTENTQTAAFFTAAVDSAAVYVNASTRFTDGGEFGLGCEMGISTQKLHARGPVGLEELTTYKYIVRGNGQIR